MIRRPLVLAALLCAALGVAVLAAGLLGAGAAPAAATAPADDLGALELGAPALDEPAPAEAPTAPPADLVVYVSGAVAAPDVYRLPAGARVKDAVLAAGGLVAAADPAAVNLAAPLADAAHIHIPERGAALQPAASAGGDAADGEEAGVNINTASEAALEALPGIGKTLAARIVSFRESDGPFASVEGLREVSGIGDKLFGQIAPLVTVGP